MNFWQLVIDSNLVNEFTIVIIKVLLEHCILYYQDNANAFSKKKETLVNTVDSEGSKSNSYPTPDILLIPPDTYS